MRRSSFRGRTAGTVGIEAGIFQGLWRPAADRRPGASSCRRAASSASSGPERRRQDDALPHDHRQEQPDDGSIRIGDSVQLAYVDQSAMRSTPTRRSGKKSRRQRHHQARQAQRSIRGPIARPSTSRAAISNRRSARFSGGQRNRVHLAKMLKSGGNVVLLDEPTNDLDTETLGRTGKMRSKTSRVGCYHQPTTACSRPPCHPYPSPFEATATSSGSKAISRIMKRTRSAASAGLGQSEAA